MTKQALLQACGIWNPRSIANEVDFLLTFLMVHSFLLFAIIETWANELNQVKGDLVAGSIYSALSVTLSEKCDAGILYPINPTLQQK